MFKTLFLADSIPGSIQDVDEIPADLKEVYRTAWELSQKSILDHVAGWGPFICQSQSTTIYMAHPTYRKLVFILTCACQSSLLIHILQTSMHFYGWSMGLKTGMYYLRTQPPSYPIQFGLEPALTLNPPDEEASDQTSSSENVPSLTSASVGTTVNVSPCSDDVRSSNSVFLQDDGIVVIPLTNEPQMTRPLISSTPECEACSG